MYAAISKSLKHKESFWIWLFDKENSISLIYFHKCTIVIEIVFLIRF